MSSSSSLDHTVNCKDTFLSAEYRENIQSVQASALDCLGKLIQKEGPSPEFTGWFDWPKNKGFDLAQKIKSFKANLNVPYDTVVVIGIGGSYLGTRAIHEVVAHSHLDVVVSKSNEGGVKPIVYAGNDLSETALIELLERLDHAMPIVNVISKSGTTTEPSIAFRVIHDYLVKRFGEEGASQRTIATTDANKGALLKIAKERDYPLFEVPDDVGGRFSVLTAVGLLPLALANISIDLLLKGADRLFSEVSEVKTGNEHAVLNYAAARKVAFDTGKRAEFLCYHEPKLLYLVEWFKQLFGESEGKDGKGLLPVGMLLSTDLHSLGQYAQDGSPIQVETFLKIKEPTKTSDGVQKRLHVPQGPAADGVSYLEGVSFSEVNKKAQIATLLAHVDADRPALELEIPDLTLDTIGYLVAFFETSCAVSGMLLGVNPYDQPGVEAYKQNLFAIMGRPGFESLGEKLLPRIQD